jgi:limonene-1,2-epoxide hydrolase
MALLKRKRSGLTDPMSVVTRFVNACNRHDADSVAACLHPEFDSIQPMYPSRNFRGADQVRRNWQAIFDAEPGFRLTVLRQAAADDTVWLELHGAGRDAEVAGVFVMGIQGDRIRWARIYSALIEPLPEGFADPAATSPATLRQVPPLREPGEAPAAEPAAVGAEGAVEEALIAPVVDIDGGGRTRRRRSSRRRSHEGGQPEHSEEGTAADAEPLAATDEPAVDEPAVDEVVPADEVVPVDDIVPADAIAPADEPAPADDIAPADEPAPEVVAAAELLVEREPEPVAEPVAEPTVSAEAAAEVEPVVADDASAGAEPEAAVEPEDLIWADLTPEESGDEAEGESQPTRSIERPGGQVRPGKRRGRKKR